MKKTLKIKIRFPFCCADTLYTTPMKTKYLLFFIILIAWTKVCAQKSPEHSDSPDSLLNKAIRLGNEGHYTQSFEILAEIKQFAERKNNWELLFRYNSNYGINLADMMNYSDALKYLLTAYNIATEHLGEREEAGALNNIAGLYILTNKHAEANKLYKKNYQYAKQVKDSVFMGGLAINIASTALSLGNMNEAKTYLDIADRIFSEKKSTNRVILENIYISYLYKLGRYNAVISHATELLGLYPAEMPYNIRLEILQTLCRAYYKAGKYAKVVEIAMHISASGLETEKKEPFYNLLSNAYEMNRQYPQALAYKDSVIIAKDSIQAINDRKTFENNKILFELMRKERETAEYQERIDRNRILLIFSVILTAAVTWALINQIMRNKQHRKITILQLEKEKKNQELLQNRLYTQKTEALLKQKELEEQLEEGQIELMSKAMFMANRNELIKDIINNMSKSAGTDKNIQLDKNIHVLKKQLEENKEWDNFMLYFEQANEKFMVKLKDKHPELSADETRFISLVFIGMSNKEISSLFNITAEYCKKKRLRLARKLGLENTTQLYNYLLYLQQ